MMTVIKYNWCLHKCFK